MSDTHVPPYEGQTFGDLIRAARNKAGLTQQELAFRARVTVGLINRWERGGAQAPMPRQVRAVCAVLDIRPTSALMTLGYLTPSDLQAA